MSQYASRREEVSLARFLVIPLNASRCNDSVKCRRRQAGGLLTECLREEFFNASLKRGLAYGQLGCVVAALVLNPMTGHLRVNSI